MAAPRNERLEIRAEHDIVSARQKVRELTRVLDFGLVDQTKMVTAASELARNTLVYGLGGFMQAEILADGTRRGLRLTFEDQGPGIANIDLALTDGWTTGKGLGKGLPGSRRLVHEFELVSQPGQGTRVTVTRWK